MKNLFNIFLLASTLVLFGCGDDHSNQAKQAKPASTPAPATTSSNDTKMENHEKMEKSGEMEKPAWAVLEQNVYHYPE